MLNKIVCLCFKNEKKMYKLSINIFIATLKKLI